MKTIFLFYFFKQIKRELKSCLLTLRLLAKFLGFLTFLPYQSINSLPEEVHPAYLEIRNNVST